MDGSVILLFGMPRSGTTWLGKIFDSHPDTLYRHEPDSIHRLTALSLLPETAVDYELRSLGDYCAGIAENRHIKVVGKGPVFDKHYLGRVGLLRYRLGIALARVAGRAGFTLPVGGSPVSVTGDVRLVWKSIESLGRLGIVLQALPEARALQIVRHPCGYIASVERGESGSRFGDLVPASEDYGLLEMLLQTRVGRSWGYSMEDIRSMHPEERLAWRWAVFNDKALADTDGDPRTLAFAYERLCEEPVTVSRNLLAHAGLEWSSQVERFVGASTGHSEKSYYSVFKDPVESAWSWETSLDQARVERILALAARSETWKRMDYGRVTRPD